MDGDANQPATRGDLVALRTELKEDLKALESRVDTKIDTLATTLQNSMESMRDQIIRAVQIMDENNRKDSVHADEHAALVNRVTNLEKEVFG